MTDTTSSNATPNVDPAEVAKFEAMASQWWDPNSEFKPLHEINPLRFEYILEHCGPLTGKKVLDIGCGGGILTESLARTGADVTGIDMGQAPLSVAKLHQHESKLEIDYRLISAEELALQEPEQFDLITCLEMLEHVPQPSSIVKACFDLLKPGGKVVFSTLNRNPKAYLFAIVGAEYILNMLPKGTHDFSKFIKPSELVNFCRDAGLKAKHMTGLHYNPLSKNYWISDSNLDVNYLLYCEKLDEIDD
jgi:2-polyprenyl-6-hydroxyphenyl methylase/3-demethylubiquinone-9 3-methyltransferase